VAIVSVIIRFDSIHVPLRSPLGSLGDWALSGQAAGIRLKKEYPMKSFRSLAVLIAIFGLSILAKAQTADFKFQVLDPPDFTSTPFAFTFELGANCPTDVQTFASNDGDGSNFGCYVATNDTGATITAIELDFTDGPGLNGQTPNCLNTGTTGPGAETPVFGASSCTEPDGGYDLFYSGGAGLAPGATVVLAEYGAAPADFGTVTATLTETPEPSSILLLSTGVLCVGVMLFRKRAQFLAV
jgi:hypothetical protein